MERTIRKILIANRGEIALRIIRTCRKLGIATVVVHSQVDAGTPAAQAADETVDIGPPEAASSYLNIEKIVQACRDTGADAVHPGYGFLAENESFAKALDEAGIIFIGPRPEVIRGMGDKIAARQLMQAGNVEVVPGYDGDDQSPENLKTEARRVGYPIMLKASAGGGGKGMRRVDDEGDFDQALESAKREAKNAFGNDNLLIEKFVTNPRHIEIQVFGDEHGNIRHLFERECSIQRRHQKVIEESPSPALTEETRKRMAETAVAAARAVKYTGAGTVEFIYSDADASFYFLEMNTRLQVEHPVTELTTGIDLVEEQIRVARGLPLSFSQEEIKQNGHAVEVRLYAEDPAREFLPAIGTIHRLTWPEIPSLRVDAGVETGNEVSIYYDPMIAKVIAHGPDRESALRTLDEGLSRVILFGPVTNLDFLRAVLNHKVFRSGKFTTNFIAEHLSDYRGESGGPDELELVRTAAGLLFYQGGKRVNDTPEPAATNVASTGGDLAPWYEMPGFRLWA